MFGVSHRRGYYMGRVGHWRGLGLLLKQKKLLELFSFLGGLFPCCWLQSISLVMIIMWQLSIMYTGLKALFIHLTHVRALRVYAMPVYKIGLDFVWPNDHITPAAAAE